MKKTLKYYQDDGHGWVAVKRKMLIDLGIEKDISSYSYESKSGQTVYLEEDRDASILVKACEGITFETIRHNGMSYIRSLSSFRPRQDMGLENALKQIEIQFSTKKD